MFNNDAELEMAARKREKEQRMLKYGARMLKEIIAACDGNMCYPINIFSADEIREAMDGVHHRYEGGFSINYYATYKDRQIVMKCYSDDDNFFNEISTVVQLNHMNMVKLLGCCFETESPILIYKLFSTNLHGLLHKANPQAPIAWENRLRIATETADAVTYLHIAKPRPIIHRNINSSSILLDEHYRPKLSGFTVSIAIPLGETHVKDKIVPNHGYLDPHYNMTGEATVKVDVYSFGLVLLELLTGKTAIELQKQASDKPNDPDLIKPEIPKRKDEKRFNFILDSRLSLMDEKKVEQWKTCMDVALKCINHEQDQRPTMKEVAQQLRGIERYQLHLPPP